MWKKINVPVSERVVVFRDDLPIGALAPGRHRIFRGWGVRVSEHRFNVDELVFSASPLMRAVLPDEWFDEVTIGLRQRGVLYRDARPQRWLRPGTHRYWVVDPSVELRVLSIDDDVPELGDELLAIIPAHELVQTTVNQHQRGLLYVQGRFERLLDPGRYAFWSHPQARVVVSLLDMRARQLTLVGQELMTRDKVTLRLTLTVEHAPADAQVLVHTVADIDAAVYLLVQLAARDYVAGVTLDELLEGRDAMTRFLETDVVPKARDIGVEIKRVGVKDVVLPGEMKVILNRVIEAEKAAQANVITRREDAAATRSMANSARIIADNPVLLELKKFEALERIAERIDEVRLVVGADSLEGLLDRGSARPRIANT